MKAEDGQTIIARSMSEKDLSDNVVSLARALGWLVHRDPTWRATGADPGYPDLTLVRHEYYAARLVFAELKTEKGKHTTPQQEWERACRLLVGGNSTVQYYVWRPSDWLDGTIEKVLR